MNARNGKTIEERLASLETLVTAGDVVSTAARLSALDARTTATEKATDMAQIALEKAQLRADKVLTERFDAANEVRGAMKDATAMYVTRGEFMWAIGIVVTVLLALLARVLAMQ